MSKEIKEEQHDWVDSAAQDARLLSNLQDSYAGERDLVNQLLGQTQMASAFEDFSRTVRTSKLAYVKENKLYRALKGQKTPNGSEILNGTWDEFCGLLGRSADKVDLDIANLKAFGEEALESMSRMGIGYREMRQYRRLDEDQKLLLIEAAKTGDKEGFIDLAEELISKHAREKAELETKLAEAQADHEAQGKVLADKNAKIDQLATDLHKATKLIESMAPDEEARHMQEQVAGITFSVEAAIRGDLNQAVSAVIERSKAIGQDPRPYLAGALLSLERTIHEIRVHHEIPVALDADTRPSVLRMGE
ncbi:MAG TPA: hypothetical protein VFW42_10845 [Fluviicoccus sp.]|nr:hypothetical protein [Fluviicoccus sp.]